PGILPDIRAGGSPPFTGPRPDRSPLGAARRVALPHPLAAVGPFVVGIHAPRTCGAAPAGRHPDSPTPAFPPRPPRGPLARRLGPRGRARPSGLLAAGLLALPLRPPQAGEALRSPQGR